MLGVGQDASDSESQRKGGPEGGGVPIMPTGDGKTTKFPPRLSTSMVFRHGALKFRHGAIICMVIRLDSEPERAENKSDLKRPVDLLQLDHRLK